MHYSLIITVHADNAIDAREYSEDYISTINKDYADWVVLGGRWSSTLCEAYEEHKTWEKYVLTVKAEYNISYFIITGSYTSKDEVAKQEAVYDLMREYWKTHLPKPFSDNPMPYDRDQYHGKYSDDVLLINDALYDKFLEGKDAKVIDDNDWLRYEDVDGDIPSKESFVNKKWIVIIDCHW